MPTFLRDAKPVSRGKVRCSLCDRVIGRGEQYRRSTLIYDDRVYDWCECDRCRMFVREVDLMDLIGDPDEGYSRDALWDIEPNTWRQARLIALVRNRWTVQGRLVDYPTQSGAPQ